MGELILREWRRDELRRIYVNDADTREPIGFFDRTTGEIVVRSKARVREVLAALKPFLMASAPIAAQRRTDARRPSRVRVEPPRQIERVVPELAPEPERLPESAPEPVLELVPEPTAEPVESVARPELELRPPPMPEMDVDLSTDIDGETVQDRAAQAAQVAAAPRVIQDLAAGLASTFAARMHRTPAPNPRPNPRPNSQPNPRPDPRPATAPNSTPPPIPSPTRPTGGTRIVGKRLDRLGRDGWRILHSVRLGAGAEVEYVAIGRPGVFTVRAWNHARAEISVDGTAVRVNGTAYPYIDECRSEAESVARRLAAAGTDVRVTPVLALVGVGGLDLSRASADCIVCRAEMVDHVLRDLPGVLTNRDQMRVYDLACRPDIWRA